MTLAGKLQLRSESVSCSSQMGEMVLQQRVSVARSEWLSISTGPWALKLLHAC